MIFYFCTHYREYNHAFVDVNVKVEELREKKEVQPLIEFQRVVTENIKNNISSIITTAGRILNDENEIIKFLDSFLKGLSLLSLSLSLSLSLILSITD